MADLHLLSAQDQARLIRHGELTSVELTRHYLDRIAQLDSKLGAYIRVTGDLALAQARVADEEVRNNGVGALSPLHGVPVALKDNFDIEDVVTGWGLAERTDEAAGDDYVVARLREAHQPILGKTHMPELALPCYTENQVGGDTRNPWSLEHSPGGSSGGSAAAVAAGLAPIALGTDAGGSVRIPASCCGLVGLRPSNGTVSGGPSDPAVTGLSTPGILARDARDAAALLSVIAGQGPGDLTRARESGIPDGPLRVGVAVNPMIAGLTVDPECRSAAENLAVAMEKRGHQIVEVQLGEDSAVADAFRDVWSVVAASHEIDDESALTGFTQMMRARGRQVTSLRLHEALTMFRGAARIFEEFVFRDVDLVITPTLASPPPLRGAFTTSPDEEKNFELMGQLMPYTPLHNITGLPALSLPIGSSGVLPVGAMLGGPYGSEHRLLTEATHLLGKRGRKGIAPGWV